MTVSNTCLPLRLQLEGDVAAALPGEGQLVRRVDLGDAAFHALLFGEIRLAAWSRGSDSSSLRQTNSNGAPAFISMSPAASHLPAHVAVGEIGPDALDRAGQQALDRQGGRLAQRAIGVDHGKVVHGRSPRRVR